MEAPVRLAESPISSNQGYLATARMPSSTPIADSAAFAQQVRPSVMDGQQVVEPRLPERKICFCDQHTVNRLVAKIIPVLLVGAAGFATWVYIAQICGTCHSYH